MATERTRRPRRSTEEVRARLLDAARELFLANGYDATTTKEISDRAEVAEKVLFGNFGSKDGIFDAAFIAPFLTLIDTYLATWTDSAQDSAPEARVAIFVEGLYDLAQRNRTILLAALNRRTTSPTRTGESDILDHLARALHQMDTVEVPGLDVPAAVVAAAGMVLGVVLLDDMLTPAGSRRIGRTRITGQMTAMIVHGALADGSAQPRPRPKR